MSLRLYSGFSCWLLTPEFLLPPAAPDIYQPLVFAGLVEEAWIDPGERERIAAAIAQAQYALVTQGQFDALRLHGEAQGGCAR